MYRIIRWTNTELLRYLLRYLYRLGKAHISCPYIISILLHMSTLNTILLICCYFLLYRSIRQRSVLCNNGGSFNETVSEKTEVKTKHIVSIQRGWGEWLTGNFLPQLMNIRDIWSSAMYAYVRTWAYIAELLLALSFWTDFKKGGYNVVCMYYFMYLCSSIFSN